MKNRKILLVAAFLLIPLILLTNESTLAGVNLCSGPEPECVRQCGEGGNRLQTPAEKEKSRRKQKQFAAAQTRNEGHQPPGAGPLAGGDSETRSNFSFFISVLVLLGGIWALVALLRQRLANRFKQSPKKSFGIWNFAFKPQFALAAFGVLFAAAIIGSVMTAPSAVKAEKRDNYKKLDKSQMVGLMNPSNKPVFKDAQMIRSTGITQIGSPVFDAAGNRYLRGGFTGNLEVGAENFEASRYFDAFFAKYDQFGNAIWARQASGATGGIAAANSIEAAMSLAVDQSGNVYVGGSFVKTITLQGGANADITLNDNGATGVNYEPFIAKYNANGDLLWARGGNSGSPKSQVDLETGQNAVSQIVFDSNGNPYLAGIVSGSNFLGSAATNAGLFDVVLARLNPATGAIVWKRTIGGTDIESGLDLDIDAANNLYLLGNFKSETITFPTVPATTFTNADNSINTFVAKFDADGANIWARELDNASTVSGSQIAVNPDGEIFLTGSFFDSAQFGDTILSEEEGSGDDDESSFGGYLAKMDTNGEFVWAEGFAGLGEAIALDPFGKVYIVGTFYDGGVFGLKSPNAESLASFGGEDIFVARYTTDGNFEWAKPIAGNGFEGTIAVGNTANPTAPTANNYNPLGIGYNPIRQTMFISGDFQNAIALDCLTLTNSGNIQAYIAEIGKDTEQNNHCRIWNGLDDDDNNFNSPDNWNGGVVPSAEDSVYVPYTGFDFDPPTYNPATNIPLSKVTIADDRILTLGRSLTITENLNLLGGFVDAESYPLFLGEYAGAYSNSDGLVLGKLEKEIPAENSGSFTFPVGTADGKGFPQYSPVTISNIMGAGIFSVSAHRGTYPNTPNLPANRANRWWNLENDGLKQVDVKFKYVDGDITQGTESQYRAYRIPTGGTGTATLIDSTIDTTAKTVSVANVSQFSDWTLAQRVAPTAAPVTIGGRVKTASGRGIPQVFVTITNSEGLQRRAITNYYGYYRFDDVAPGQTYVFNARRRGLDALSLTQVHSIQEDRNDIDFTESN